MVQGGVSELNIFVNGGADAEWTPSFPLSYFCFKPAFNLALLSKL